MNDKRLRHLIKKELVEAGAITVDTMDCLKMVSFNLDKVETLIFNRLDFTQKIESIKKWDDVHLDTLFDYTYYANFKEDKR